MRFRFLREQRAGATTKVIFTVEREQWGAVRLTGSIYDISLVEIVPDSPRALDAAKRKMTRRLTLLATLGEEERKGA